MRLKPMLAVVLLVGAACSGASHKTTAKGAQSSPSSVVGGKGKPVKAEALFVVNGNGGTAGAVNGGTFPLAVTGVHPNALFFTDRPVRDSGFIHVDGMLDVLGRGTSGPPNGAIEVLNGDQGPVVAAVELTDTKYDAATATFRAQAKILPNTPGPHLQHYNKRHLAQQLPSTFGQAALFIDTAPFGSTNFCEIQAYNDSSGNASLNATSHWDTDSWDPPPPNVSYVLPSGNHATWQSDGGFARGCGTSADWTLDDGTHFHMSITDPYGSDPNTITCSSSDDTFHPCHIGTDSTLRGPSISVHFHMCDLHTNPGCAGN